VFRKLMNRKRLSVLGVVAVLAVAGAAVAYWTASGSGSGSGKVAESNGTLVLHGVIAEALTPGSTSSVTLTAENKGSSNLYVGTVTEAVSIDAEHVSKGCLVGDFSTTEPVENQTILAGKTEALKPGSITMANTLANQDGCKGAEITLTLNS